MEVSFTNWFENYGSFHAGSFTSLLGRDGRIVTDVDSRQPILYDDAFRSSAMTELVSLRQLYLAK